MTAISDLKTLYTTDFNLGLKTTTQLVQKIKLEPIESCIKNALCSNLRIWKHQLYQHSNNWKDSILESCFRIIDCLENNPSLKSYFEDIFSKTDHNSLLIASREMGLNKKAFFLNFPFQSQM